MTEAECFQHLSNISLGRIAVSIDALPVILPVRFTLSDESVVFPTVTGSKLDMATAGTVLAFQADAQDASNGDYWSVLVQGIGSALVDPAGGDDAAIPLTAWPDLKRKLHLVQIEPSVVSGRRFRVAGEDPSPEFPDAPAL